MHFLYMNCSGFAYSDSTEAFGPSTLAIFENFLVFYFTFTFLFTETGYFSCNFWSVAPFVVSNS